MSREPPKKRSCTSACTERCRAYSFPETGQAEQDAGLTGNIRADSFPETGQAEQDAGPAGNIEKCGPVMNFTRNKIRKIQACLQLSERNERLL